MAHKEHGRAGELLPNIPYCPLDIPELVFPGRFTVRAVGALVFLVQGGPPVASCVVRKDCDAALGPDRMSVLVSSDVFCKSMDKDEDRLGLSSFICTGVKLGARMTGQPSFNVNIIG